MKNNLVLNKMFLENIFYVFLIFIISVNFAFSQTKIKLDLKTPINEKTNLMPAKIGAIYYLMQSDWAALTEVGEDYSVWLKNYQKSKDDDKITVKLELEIRTPSMIRSGSLLASDKIEVSFTVKDDWKDVQSLSQALEKEIKTITKEIQTEAVVTGKEILNALYRMKKKLK